MALNLLHFDDALLSQPLFMQECARLGASEIDLRDVGPEMRLWAREPIVERVRQRLRDSLTGVTNGGPILSWSGSGDFHHVTALITGLMAEVRGKPITIVQFDNHPDWVSFAGGLHCGSWVRHVLDAGIASRVVGLGMTSRDLAWPEFKGASLDHVASGRLVLFSLDPPKSIVIGNYGAGPGHEQRGRRIFWRSFPSEGGQKATEEPVLTAIGTEAIYITIDKDILTPAGALTNWDQGLLTLGELLAWLDVLMRRFTILGIDITGDYSAPNFSGSSWDRLKKMGESILDHPGRPKDTDTKVTAALNQATNLQLLSALRAHLC